MTVRRAGGWTPRTISNPWSSSGRSKGTGGEALSAGGSVGFGIVLLGVIIGILVAQPNIDRAMQDLEDARTEYSEEMLGIRNTQFSIGNAVYNATNKELKMDLSNTGTTVIGGSAIDVLIDGTITSPTAGTALRIYPGEKVTLTMKSATKPISVIVVGPYGISSQIGSEAIASK